MKTVKVRTLVAGIVLLLLAATGIALATMACSQTTKTWKRTATNQCAGQQNRTKLREATQAQTQEET